MQVFAAISSLQADSLETKQSLKRIEKLLTTLVKRDDNPLEELDYLPVEDHNFVHVENGLSDQTARQALVSF